MIEVDVFVEPLNSSISLISTEECKVNWIQVLQSALRAHELMSRFSHCVIAFLNTEREPPLFDLRVNCSSQVEVLVDPFQDVKSSIVHPLHQS